MNRIVLLTVLATAVLEGRSFSEEPNLSPLFSRELPADLLREPMMFPEEGLWKVEYDQSLDGDLKPTHSHVLEIQAANNRLSGHYQDQRAEGKDNDSVFTGEFVPGTPSIVTLRQDDLPQYTAIYTGRLVSEDRIVGTYLDNHGMTGDWSMTLMTDRILEPLTTEFPSDEIFESVLGVYGKAIRGDRYPFVNLRPPHRNLWTAEIQEHVQATLPYGDVDYIATASLVILESGTYTIELPGAGVQFRVNDQLLEAGDVVLKRGVYKVEIYTNHWGQPYLTYAAVNVFKQGTKTSIPLVNTAADIEEFRSQTIQGKPVVEVCKYELKQVEI